MTTSLINGFPNRETCIQLPSDALNGGVLLRTVSWRRLAVAQTPMTESLGPLIIDLGTERTMLWTFSLLR